VKPEPDTAVDDQALVERMARGDAEALGALYDLHSPLLRALATRVLGNAAAAEDLVHDVFLEAWQHAGEYDPGRGSVRTWLTLRARSRAIDRKKSAPATRTVHVGDSGWLERMAADTNDASSAPDRARVRRVLLDLPEEQCRVLLLGYFEGLSSSEIAARVGVPIGTVKSRVAAALSRLRAELLPEAQR
jgi:RNA polymerase sigma-70 factor, ECF subfamily